MAARYFSKSVVQICPRSRANTPTLCCGFWSCQARGFSSSALLERTSLTSRSAKALETGFLFSQERKTRWETIQSNNLMTCKLCTLTWNRNLSTEYRAWLSPFQGTCAELCCCWSSALKAVWVVQGIFSTPTSYLWKVCATNLLLCPRCCFRLKLELLHPDV